MLNAVSWYQRGAAGRPSPCRFFPSCSAYAHEAIEVHGAGRGLWLTVRRLVRCRPFGPSGFDPVPYDDAHGAHADGDHADGAHAHEDPFHDLADDRHHQKA